MIPPELKAQLEEFNKTLPEETGSEFGRGYATCLIMFTFHRNKLDDDLATYRRIQNSPTEPRSTRDLFTEGHAVEQWANGSSDHLYELTRPPRGIKLLDWRNAEHVKNRALEVGHGFRYPRQDSNANEMHDLLNRADMLLANIGVNTYDEALAWDKAHGLRVVEGQWKCTSPMRRRLDDDGNELPPSPRRRKVMAMAQQKASPREAEVARDKLRTMA